MKFGIIGAGGYWGPNWVRVLQQINVLAAVCDSDPAALGRIDKKYDLEKNGIGLHSSAGSLLAVDLDGVFIVTPPATHSEIAIRAMGLGKHVFIEKPLALNLEECYKIKFTAERYNKIVMVGHTFIYHPAVQAFKKSLPLIGNIQTIYTVRTNFGRYQSSGIIIDLLPHDLSIFNFLCAAYPDEVKAHVNPYQDVAFVTATYGKIICNAFLSWGYPDKTRKLAAIGDKGILEWNLTQTHLLFHKKWIRPGPSGRFEHYDEGSQNIMVFDQSEPLMNEALHFINCIKENVKPLTDIEDGINVVKGIEKCL